MLFVGVRVRRAGLTASIAITRSFNSVSASAWPASASSSSARLGAEWLHVWDLQELWPVVQKPELDFVLSHCKLTYSDD